jgi:hypothetical protein
MIATTARQAATPPARPGRGQSRPTGLVVVAFKVRLPSIVCAQLRPSRDRQA